MTDRSFTDYYQATHDKPPHPILLTLESHLKEPGLALDLGCGAGRAVVWLRERGWTVEAVEREQEGLDLVRRRVGDDPKVRLVLSDLGRYEPPPCDLAISLFTLFFLPREDLEALWCRLEKAVRPGGLFAGQFMGPHDDWKDCTHLTRSEVEAMLDGWEVLHYEEADQDGETSLGAPKHWHIHHVIARRR